MAWSRRTRRASRASDLDLTRDSRSWFSASVMRPLRAREKKASSALGSEKMRLALARISGSREDHVRGVSRVRVCLWGGRADLTDSKSETASSTRGGGTPARDMVRPRGGGGEAESAAAFNCSGERRESSGRDQPRARRRSSGDRDGFSVGGAALPLPLPAA